MVDKEQWLARKCYINKGHYHNSIAYISRINVECQNQWGMSIEKLLENREIRKNIKPSTLNEQLKENLLDSPHMHSVIDNGHS